MSSAIGLVIARVLCVNLSIRGAIEAALPWLNDTSAIIRTESKVGELIGSNYENVCWVNLSHYSIHGNYPQPRFKDDYFQVDVSATRFALNIEIKKYSFLYHLNI